MLLKASRSPDCNPLISASCSKTFMYDNVDVIKTCKNKNFPTKLEKTSICPKEKRNK